MVSESKRIKLDPDQSDLDEKIVKQVEYYFSDLNIIKDKFLLEELKKDDGWVKLETLLKFSRLKQLTTDETRLLEALSRNNSEIIDLDEGKKQIRRKNPVPDAEELQKDLDLRTVHISGFPTDYEFESLHQFCTRYGDVESVMMRRLFKTRLFKGCIHVVFKKEEDAKKVLELDVLMCKDRELRRESMEAYYKRKKEQAEKRKAKRKKSEA